jgi:hypothetical protein
MEQNIELELEISDKVYILIICLYGEKEILEGVYATKEAAINAQNEYERNGYYVEFYDEYELYILEEKVQK